MSEIIILVEGATEQALKESLTLHLNRACTAALRPQVRLRLIPAGSDLLHSDRQPKLVNAHLSRPGVLGVVALVDVRAGGDPHRFRDAQEAIQALRIVGPADPRFFAHAAQYDVEAWLLPYWGTACRLAGRTQNPPGAAPERVNENHPPSWHLRELFRLGSKSYSKPRHAAAILRGQDLMLATTACPQFKAFLNTLLDLAGCARVP